MLSETAAALLSSRKVFSSLREYTRISPEKDKYISDGYINIKYKLRKERVINFFKTRLKETDGKN